MPAPKEAADQSRKFGFKESREQYEQRKKQEKQVKWNEKLAKEDLGKLQAELESLDRARFLAPQQNERKRLVLRMIRDMQPAEDREPEVAAPVAARAPSPAESDSDDDVLFAKGTTTNDEHRRLFVPRSIRKKPEETKPPEEKTAEQMAHEAEKELLAAVGGDEDVDAFLDSL
ncbi:hypothetical protein NESM_000615400 [Novymonas esmeraldas]|uniref:Uncharacterized protein n=1 Tax=Novymonas esmeraldas TaxID=1808958 RepID=A0AAW0ET23_9TRYP